jgi:hypothetical protein
MSRLPAAVGFGLALLMTIRPACADDGWNPFKTRDDPRRAEHAASPRAPERASDDRRPLLAPMEGIATKPWLGTDSRTETSPAGYADPPIRRPSNEQAAPWFEPQGSLYQGPPRAPAPAPESVQRTELQPLPSVPNVAPPNTRADWATRTETDQPSAPVASAAPPEPRADWTVRTETSEPPAPVASAAPSEPRPDWTVRTEASQPPAPVASATPPNARADWTARTEARQPSVSWRGLDAAKVGEMISHLSIPPRSAPLAKLWQRLLSAEDGPSSADRSENAMYSASFDAVRMEALYRSGLVTQLRKIVADLRPNPDDPVETLLVARTRIVLGDREPGCVGVKSVQPVQSSLPKSARQDFLLLAALCGVGDGDAGKARIGADLLRSEGVSDAVALASLDALASGNPGSFKMPTTKTSSPLDYRFLELVGAEPIVAGAEPALLAIMAATDKTAQTRVAAAEAALALHAIPPGELATAYRSARFSEQALAQPFAESQPPPLQRALLFQAFDGEKSTIKKARFARALLDEVRRAGGAYMQVAGMLAPAADALRPTPKLAWFTETAIEINLAGNRLDAVRDWISASSGSKTRHFDDWLALADISAANWRGHRGESLHAVEQRAVHGELAPELMHRIVTVLDALDYQIPIPLWEAASRTQQPTNGFLPETGVLSELQNASRQGEQGMVVLLAMRALGPESGATAHMIALGDTSRALKRVGLEAEARQLGLEALYMAWPRSRID